MIRPGPLYTWVDIESELNAQRLARHWPIELLGFSAFHDALVLYVRADTNFDHVAEALRDWFGDLYQPDNGILLKALPGEKRILPVVIERDEGSVAPALEFRPSFERISLIADQFTIPPPAALCSGAPPLIAFYSFKGGVGRTVHLLALLRALSERKPLTRVLLVDADFEAPGISSLVTADGFGEPLISVADLLALCHSEPAPLFENAASARSIQLVAEQLKAKPLQMVIGGSPVEHYFLPAFRESEQALRLEIKPEHLTQATGANWALANIFAHLGRLLAVQAVLIDLRAGLSELSSPLLFDPRVRRAIVSTPSIQSVDGNIMVLRQLAKFRLDEREDLSEPTVIITFVTQDLLKSPYLIETEERFLSTYPERSADQDSVSQPPLRVERTTFAQELLVIGSLNDLMVRLQGTDVSKLMRSLADDWVPVRTLGPELISETLDLDREKLRSFSEKLEFAESGEGDKFLTTPQLRALAHRFRIDTPIAVVIGQKGAGKTYTYFQLVRHKLWSAFLDSTLKSSSPKGSWGLIWPLLRPRNLKKHAQDLLADCSRETRDGLNLHTEIALPTRIQDEINEALRLGSLDESLWRQNWFRLIALSLGLSGDSPSVDDDLVHVLSRESKRVIVVIDGLEEQFPGINEDVVQQTALRALLQGLPARLAEYPDCPLGLLVFVRADFVKAAISQNIGQFERLYEPFGLRWDRQQALRLAVWLCRESGILRSNSPDPESLNAEQAAEILYPVWGRKLGHDKSREARTNEYVISGLSDFKGQVQARDLVRLFRYAAEFSRGSSSTDRLLVPSAVRKALKPCSEQKISEIQQEIPGLSGIFGKLREGADKRIPFRAEDFQLSSNDVRLLEETGVILQDNHEYYMPEIFRLGFGFQLAGGARPRVLSLAKRAQMTRPLPLS